MIQQTLGQCLPHTSAHKGTTSLTSNFVSASDSLCLFASSTQCLQLSIAQAQNYTVLHNMCLREFRTDFLPSALSSCCNVGTSRALYNADGPLKLYGENAKYAAIAKEVESIDGVVTHGLFVDVAQSAAMFTSEGVQWFDATVAEVQDSL